MLDQTCFLGPLSSTTGAKNLYSCSLLLWRRKCYTLVITIAIKFLPFQIPWMPRKRWVVQPSSLPYIRTKILSHSAKSLRISKSISSSPFTMYRGDKKLPLEISIWATLKCHKTCKGVYFSQLLIGRGFVGACIQLLKVTRTFSVVGHTHRHIVMGQKPYEMAKNLFFFRFFEASAFAPVAPPFWIL